MIHLSERKKKEKKKEEETIQSTTVCSGMRGEIGGLKALPMTHLFAKNGKHLIKEDNVLRA